MKDKQKLPFSIARSRGGCEQLLPNGRKAARAAAAAAAAAKIAVAKNDKASLTLSAAETFV